MSYLAIRRMASHATKTPPASSITPAPTSHESMCPPITTTSSGLVVPRTSAMMLRDCASSKKCASMYSLITTGMPRLTRRSIRSASSWVMAAPGMPAGSMLPVCGVDSEYGAIERTRLATAP